MHGSTLQICCFPSITDDEHRSVAQLLQHVPTVKALSSIRLSVFDVLKEVVAI